jgi:hypothetical protein
VDTSDKIKRLWILTIAFFEIGSAGEQAETKKAMGA